MAVAFAPVDVWTERRRRVAELRGRHGFARQVLDFYGTLLSVQERAFAEATEAAPSPSDLVAYVAEVVFPGVVDVSVAAGPDRLRSDVIRRTGSVNAHEMIRGWLEGEEQGHVDRYLSRASLGPVLEALGQEARAVGAGPRDARHCPDCGGPPQLSYVEVSADDLATGPRRLVCARCGASWGYPRMTCAGCGESSSPRLKIFSEHGTTSGERGSLVRGLPSVAARAAATAVFPHIRIEACDTCHAYVQSIDLATEPVAVPVVDEISAIPLDLYARDRGYSKVTTNLMGF